MENSIRLEDLFYEGIVGCKAVVRTGGLGEEEAHGITLVTKCRLHSDEDIAILLAIDKEMFTIRIEVARGLAPALLQCRGIGSEGLVLAHGHFVSNVEVGAAELGLLVMDDIFNEAFRGIREAIDIVPISLEIFEDRVDGGEDIEICC